MTKGPRVRKQVFHLTALDLERSPVWELALDEEGEGGQDEATVRPLEADGETDPGEGMLVVRAILTLADGTGLRGYLTPSRWKGADLGTIQPHVVTDAGQVGFWRGRATPSPEELAQAYQLLGKSGPSGVFPLRFESDVPLVGGPIRGEVHGFCVLEDLRTGRFRVVT